MFHQDCWTSENPPMLPILKKTQSTVIALISKMKNTTVRKCSFGDVMKKPVPYKKVTKQIFICYCNTVKCSAELTAKKAFQK